MKRAIFFVVAILIIVPGIARASDSERCGDVQLLINYGEVTASSVRVVMERMVHKEDIFLEATLILDDDQYDRVGMMCGITVPAAYCDEDDPNNCYIGEDEPIIFDCSRDIAFAALTDIEDIERVEVDFVKRDNNYKYTCVIDQDLLFPPVIEGNAIRTLDGVDVELAVDEPDWVGSATLHDDYCISQGTSSDEEENFLCELAVSDVGAPGNNVVKFKSTTLDSPLSNIKHIVKVNYRLPVLSSENAANLIACPEHSSAAQDGDRCECDAGFIASTDGVQCNKRFLAVQFHPIHMYPFFTDDQDEEGDQEEEGAEEEVDIDPGFQSIVPGGDHTVPVGEADDAAADDIAADDSNSDGATTATVGRGGDVYGGGACSIVNAVGTNPLSIIMLALSFIPIIMRRRLR